MSFLRGNPVNVTKLTRKALQLHLASGTGIPFNHGYEYEKLDNCVSEANADCGVGSSHSQSLTNSPFSDIPRFGCPGDTARFVCRGTWDRGVVPCDSDEEDIILDVEPDTEYEPLMGTRVVAARLALTHFDRAFAGGQTLSVESTMPQRNTAEGSAVFAFIEKRNAQIDVEKTEVSVFHKPAVITIGQGLAGMVAATAILGGVIALTLLTTGMDRSAIVACGASLFLAMLAVVLMTKR